LELEKTIIDFFKNNPYPHDDMIHRLAINLDIDKIILENKIYEALATLLNGGNSFKKTVGDSDQLKKGIKIEMEHLDSKSPFAELLAEKIAKDHIVEDKKYYDKLLKMEASNKLEKCYKNLKTEIDRMREYKCSV
jgi:hypothetical protein